MRSVNLSAPTEDAQPCRPLARVLFEPFIFSLALFGLCLTEARGAQLKHLFIYLTDCCLEQETKKIFWEYDTQGSRVITDLSTN